jgi:transposase InsO family protein
MGNTFGLGYSLQEEESTMPWKESTCMSERHEFVLLATAPEANFSLLCRRFCVSRKTGYKWLRRYFAGGVAALSDQSRCPNHSPRRTPASVEESVLALRTEHPYWGGRKLRARLCVLGQTEVPAPSTITSILRRHDRIKSEDSLQHRRYHRFEHAAPNDLWQMDFKGDFSLSTTGRCYPLTVLDDHSRFSLGLRACPSQHREGVQQALTSIFRRYGLPWRMTMDNGFPWGVYVGGRCRWTQLTLWLTRLGIRVSHSRPYHPQTQGKDERFHRTLKLELLGDCKWRDLAQCQASFDRWRETYNCERPHEALQMQVPASRYRESVRCFPEELPAIEYPSEYLVRRVQKSGMMHLHGRQYYIGEAFRGLEVGLCPTTTDAVFEVYFCHRQVMTLDLRVHAE